MRRPRCRSRAASRPRRRCRAGMCRSADRRDSRRARGPACAHARARDRPPRGVGARDALQGRGSPWREMEHAPCQTRGMAFAVLTRDAADTMVYAAALAPLEVVAMPVTRTVEQPIARDCLDGVDAIVVASPRAAQQLARIAHGELPAVWAVGPATKRALEIA